jgi:hypothetical protein
VRHGHVAAARTVIEDSVADATGFTSGRLLVVTFKRKFDTGSVNDKVLGFGKKYFINVARNDNAGAATSAKHTEKASSAAAIDLLRRQRADSRRPVRPRRHVRAPGAARHRRQAGRLPDARRLRARRGRLHH